MHAEILTEVVPREIASEIVALQPLLSEENLVGEQETISLADLGLRCIFPPIIG